MNLPTYYRGAGILFAANDSSGMPNVLLGKRKFRPYAGYWSIPGGAMEPIDGGDFRNTAAREIFEETINVKSLVDIQQQIRQRLSSSPEIRGSIPFVFDWRTYLLTLSQMPDIRLWPNTDHWQNEFSGFGWFAVNEVPRPLHPGLGRAIRRFTHA